MYLEGNRRKAEKVFTVFLIACLACVTTPLIGLAARKDQNTSSYVQAIVEHRTMAQERVVRIKERYKPGDAVYEKARSLYDNARAMFTALIASTRSAIKNGEELPTLESEGERAVAANKEFCDYVDGALVRPKASESIGFTDLFSIGKWVFGEIMQARSERKAKKREKLAKRFEEDTRWKTWNKVVDE